MARLDKTIKDYQEQLKEKGIDNIPEFVQSILDADITKGKYGRFLLDCYLNDKFRNEDLMGGLNSTIGQAISLFDKHKSKLPENMRSVYALNKATGKVLYQSPGDLWNSVKQFQGELSGKELKKEEQERIYRETEFVYKDEETGFQIISPLTEESAKWWGKGTRWCTSAENDNMFWAYAKKAPLFVIIMPNCDKLQLWKYKNNIQFMDEADNNVSLDYIEQNWNILEPICLWLNDLKFIPEKYRTKELCELVIKQNGIALEFIPKELITEELCELAVKQNGWSLDFVPEYLKTKEMCKLAVKQSGWAIKYVPEEYITKEMCELAVKNDGYALQYVPEKLITEELCELAVKNDGRIIFFIKKYLTPELCKLAVENDGKALFSIPEHLITEYICKRAVEQNGDSLQYVPEKLKTEELCKIAVQQNGLILCHVLYNMRTEELCELAVKNDGNALKYVSYNMRTEELCKIAVENNGDSLRYVPEEFKGQLKQYIKPPVISEEIYQQMFSDIQSFFPEKSLSFKL